MLALQVGAYDMFSVPLAIVSLLHTFDTSSNSRPFVVGISGGPGFFEYGVSQLQSMGPR